MRTAPSPTLPAWARATLLAEGDHLDAVQDDLRKAIAKLALPDERELKKLIRYRKLLEDGLHRLAALKQLRKHESAEARSAEYKDAARGYRVRLRVLT